MPDEQNDSQNINSQPALPPSEQPVPEPPKSSKKSLLAIVIVVLVLILGVAVHLMRQSTHQSQIQQPTTTNSQAKQETAAQNVQGLQLDPQKNYGDKYANGILPVGDNQYSATTATKGKVYVCNANFVPTSQAGAQSRGPWFIGTTQWDINKKYAVQGSVNWQSQLTNKVAGSTRTITTNDLPNHITGIFPVASSDPAAKYDRNPNSISAQSLTYSLASNPGYGTPQCMGGEAGVMLTGVALFSAFDAGGRDAGAWEIQDSCQGHPQSSGVYHYHSLSSCIKNVSVNNVIGFALDGFPITGPKVGDGNILTTDDLDECHGITSEITLDGKKVTMYHYVMTQDFPYSISCFRAKAIQSPAQHTGGQQNQSPPPPPSRP